METMIALSWRRAVKDTLDTGTKRRTWISTDGRFRLEEHHHLHGQTLYLPFVRDYVFSAGEAGVRAYWNNLGSARSRAIAEQRLLTHAEDF